MLFSRRFGLFFFFLGLLGLSFVIGVFFSISMSKKIDFDKALQLVNSMNYEEADQKFKYVYNEYSSSSGKDSYQKTSVIALGFLRSKYVNQQKLNNIFQELDKLYEPDVSKQLKAIFEEYKLGMPIDAGRISGINKKEKELLITIVEVFQSPP